MKKVISRSLTDTPGSHREKHFQTEHRSYVCGFGIVWHIGVGRLGVLPWWVFEPSCADGHHIPELVQSVKKMY
jgi:hypothetical protein